MLMKKKIPYDYAEKYVLFRRTPSDNPLCSGFHLISVDHTSPMRIKYEYLKVPA